MKTKLLRKVRSIYSIRSFQKRPHYGARYKITYYYVIECKKGKEETVVELSPSYETVYNMYRKFVMRYIRRRYPLLFE